MTIAFVASAAARNVVGGGLGPATTGAINTAGANFLVLVSAFYSGGGGNPAITDSKGNTYTALTQYNAGSGLPSVRIYYCANPTVGSGHTFTADDAVNGSYSGIAAAAFSGVKITSPHDQQNGANSAGYATSQATGSITPAEDNELIISGVGWAGDTALLTVDSGMEIANQLDSTADAVGVALSYKTQGSLAAINVTWTSITNQVIYAAAVASFKAASASGSTDPYYRMMRSA